MKEIEQINKLPKYQSVGFISFMAFLSYPAPGFLVVVAILLILRKKKLGLLKEEQRLLQERAKNVLSNKASIDREKLAFEKELMTKKELLEKEIITRKELLEKELQSTKALLAKEISLSENEIALRNEELESLRSEIFFEYIDTNNYEDLTSEEIGNKLTLLRLDQKNLIKNEEALDITTDNTKSYINNISKKILRCFNTETDQVISKVSHKNMKASRNRLVKSFEQLNKLFDVNGVAISTEYLDSKLEEMNLFYNYELKKEQEREIQQAIKEQMLEEEKVRKEIENEKKKIEKEEKQFKGEVDKLIKYMQKTDNEIEKNIYADKIRELEEKIGLLEKDKENVLNREQNTRAGFVYIISNIGSFGENVYKIGMTRRLEPMDRIKELSSASVPFNFDVHAMIFSEDAPTLENELHKAFKEYEVNKVNSRKEFFNVDLNHIESVVRENYSSAVEFVKTPKSSEYLESCNVQQ